MAEHATIFDIVVGGTLLVSALIGLARGGIREVLSVAAFIAAALAALRGAPLLWDGVGGFITPPWLAKLATVFVIFVGVYLAVAMVTNSIEKLVRRHGDFGLIDRILGLAFGVFRALFVVGLGLILIDRAVPEDQLPREARTYPVARQAADVIESVTDPTSFVGRVARRGAAALPEVEESDP